MNILASSSLIDTSALQNISNDNAARIQRFRGELKNAEQQLQQLFEQDTSATQLVTLRAGSIDVILQQAWLIYFNQDEIENLPTLVAVGGYGRKELHPGSDIDIMLLLPAAEDEALHQAIVEFLTFLWDIGLEVGHSVRTTEECIEQALADITIATNLMEARLLYGATNLFENMREQVDADHIWPSRDFFEAKWQEQINRHNKFDDTAYKLEPNIKEGPGGLRDIQMIGWVAKRHYGVDTLRDLIAFGYLTEDEYALLCEHREFLWQIRFALHVIAKRREDRLLFNFQREIAAMLNFSDDENQLGVENFMKQYYRTVGELSRLNEMLLQLFQEVILYSDQSEEPSPINERFQSRRGFIETVSEDTFKQHPSALLEIFLLLEKDPSLKGVRAETIRLIRASRNLIDDDFRANSKNKALFIDIISQPQGITHEFRRMHRYGILGAYLPNFEQVTGQMQYDLFHIYTVDEHTLFVVRNLRRFTIAEFAHELPHCSEVIKHIPKPELLYLAGLFHDIAKGRGGDHSELGEGEARDFCLNHGLSAYNADIVAWLVRNHLVMSRTSQREDISDPDVINKFADLVDNRDKLDYLYLLTIADMRATSPDVWNNWKGSLLKELYTNTLSALRKRIKSIDDDAHIDDIKNSVLENFKSRAELTKPTQALWANLSEDYFLRYSANEITLHAENIIKHNSTAPLIVLNDESDRGGTEIFIHTQVHKGLFTAVTSLLEQIGLNILDARIVSSSDGKSYDSYIVLNQNGDEISIKSNGKEICDALTRVLSEDSLTITKVNRISPRQHRHFPTLTEVKFSEDIHHKHSIMEVISTDQPGLLAIIGNEIDKNNILLHNARISTFGTRVEDLFFITDENNNLLAKQLQLQLSESIAHKLTSN